MLKVRIELAPEGNESAARTLRTLAIANVDGTSERGTYSCTLRDEQGIPLRHAVITDWPRLDRDAAALVHEALSRLLDNR